MAMIVLWQLLAAWRILPVNEGLQGQTNIIRAEEYVYNAIAPKMVIVGSSLTANIKAAEIDPLAFNLGMIGGCSQTGLEVILHTSYKPEIVLVEVNETLVRKLDTQLLDSLYQPGMHLVRRYLAGFRQAYQPSGVLFSFVKHLAGRRTPDPTQPDELLDSPRAQSVREELIRESIKMHSVLRTPEAQSVFVKEVEHLRNQIDLLKKSGVRVILLQIPGEQRVRQTLREGQDRQLLRAIFPESHYTWLGQPPQHLWTTSDGAHLVARDSRLYAHFIRTRLLLSVSRVIR